MLFDVQYESDPLGRIARKVETTNGTVHIYVCNYSISGYLERVSVDGVTASSYGFDLNGNRISYSGVLGNRNATYDAQDRMLTYGGASYSYNANGELATRTEADTTTRYEYDLLGNLKKVVLSNGKVIEYIVDGNNRRIGKKVNGVMVHTWMYESQLCPAAEYDGAGNLIARFVYGTKANVPEYMVKNGLTYRIITDHLGSVRYIVETSSGEIAQSLIYDEYGVVLSDNNPGFTPFGFAGGMYDSETGLVRFGARDYDAQSGRWTSKDPIGFRGGDVNLFAYCLNDPINWTDPFGEENRKPGKTPPTKWPNPPIDVAGKKPKWNSEGYWEGKGGKKITWDNKSHGAGQRGNDGHWDDEGSDEQWDKDGRPLGDKNSKCTVDSPEINPKLIKLIGPGLTTAVIIITSYWWVPLFAL